MTEEIEQFDKGNAVLVLGNALKEHAMAVSQLSPDDTAIALFKASAGVLYDLHGKENWLPILKVWLNSLIASEDEPTTYN